MSNKENNNEKGNFNYKEAQRRHQATIKRIHDLSTCGDPEVINERRICPYIRWATKCNFANPCKYKGLGVIK